MRVSCYRISLSIDLAATFSDVVCMKYGERRLTKSAVARSVDEWSIFIASPRMMHTFVHIAVATKLCDVESIDGESYYAPSKLTSLSRGTHIKSHGPMIGP